MSLFSAKDVFEFAVRIEENGEKFYRDSARKLANPEIKKLFVFLADEEVRHKQTFEKLAARMGSMQLPKQLDADYKAYLDAYSENLIFTESDTDRKIADIDDERTALFYALEKELDTIHYYREIRELIPASEQGLIEKIIDEERSHVVKLAEMKQKIT